jgi:cyclophilin family peptidyl-prolyl cis-trans isomerase/predicted Ser/Thr protein kinase
VNDDTFSSTARRTADPGRAIGPYRVVRELGRGGMGAVYLCEDTAVGDRPVALKVVLDPEAGGTEARERFQREIRHLGTLRHRNIVQVLFAGEHEGRPYFVMEYVPGRDLGRHLEDLRGKPEEERLAEIVRLMARVADGVAFAHQAGIVHRDLKPQNIIVRDDGEPMILDFGIARRAGDVSMTGAGPAPGTPSFMAPEQFEGGGDPAHPEAADVWALGAILYLALTGERPFPGRSSAAVAYQVVHQPPIAPRRVNPHTPEAVEAVVLRALEKDPRRRFPTAAAFRDALVSGAAAGARARFRRGATKSIAVALAAMALVVFLWRPWEGAPREAERFATLLRVDRRDVSFDATTVDVASFDPICLFGLDGVPENVPASAVLLDPQGFEISRVPLNPAERAYEAAFRIPPDLRREGLVVTPVVEAEGRAVPVRPATLRFILDATPPRWSGRVVAGADVRPYASYGDETPSAPPGAAVELFAEDAGEVTERTIAVDGMRREATPGPDGALRIEFTAPGEHEIAATARDRAGNEDRRTFRVRITAPESRPGAGPDSRAGSRPAVRRDLAAFPESPGRLERLGAITDFTRPATVELRDGLRVLVRNDLGPFELVWLFRLRDAAGVVLGESRLEPGGLLGSRSYVTVGGVLDLAGKTPAAGPLTPEFVFRDANGAEVVRRPAVRLDWRAPRPPAPKTRVRFETSAGAFTVEIDRTAAPSGAAVFLACVEAGFYQDTVLHDVVPEAYVAGGRYTVGLAVKVDRSIPAATNEWDRPGALRNTALTLALAHDPGDPGSARGRFIINLADQPARDEAKFTVVGRVVGGEDVLRRIAATPVERRGELARVPRGPVVVHSAAIE